MFTVVNQFLGSINLQFLFGRSQLCPQDTNRFGLGIFNRCLPGFLQDLFPKVGVAFCPTAQRGVRRAHVQCRGRPCGTGCPMFGGGNELLLNFGRWIGDVCHRLFLLQDVRSEENGRQHYDPVRACQMVVAEIT